MYIPLRRVVLSLPTEDETPEEFEQTVMIGHAATGTPHGGSGGIRSLKWSDTGSSGRDADAISSVPGHRRCW